METPDYRGQQGNVRRRISECHGRLFKRSRPGADLYRGDEREILQTLAPEAIVSTYRSYEQQKLLELLSWADAVCIGSGIGTSEVSAKILKSTLEKGKGPFVIDADGLNLLAEHHTRSRVGR